MRFNAWDFARSWSSVALAQGEDDSRPALFRTTLIEVFDGRGVRLVSTDTFVFLKAWISEVDGDPVEPRLEELPDEVAICRDVDHQVLGLMKYIQKVTKSDGSNTPITISMETGETPPDTPTPTLEGLQGSTVKFRMVEMYDQMIESPVFDGVFPNWRPIWDGHVWKPASYIGFGANGILRLGGLSKLWDKAVIHFELGGSVGVAKIRIEAPDVNVTGLVMPTSRPPDEPEGDVPPSVESELQEFADRFEEWRADLLATEQVEDPELGEMIEAATNAQIRRAAELALGAGYASQLLLRSGLDIEEEHADRILARLVEDGILGQPDEVSGKYPILVDELGDYLQDPPDDAQGAEV